MTLLVRNSAALMRSRSISLALLTATVVACGGGGGGGTTNPPPTQKLGSVTAPATINLAAGNTSTIVPAALDETGGSIVGVSSFGYQSNATAVAEVSANGTVLGISAGAATITVSLTLEGITKTTTVAVTVTGTLPLSKGVAAGGSTTDFQPPLVGIAAGGTVDFSFGQLDHNVTFDATAGAPTDIPTGNSRTVTKVFPTAGNFNYRCTLHGGMTGRVVVR